MKSQFSLRNAILLFLVAVLLSSVPLPVLAQSPTAAELAAQILDTAKSTPDREAIISANSARAAELMTALVKDFEPGTPEEYKRIPWIWRVAIASGKRNNADELKNLLAVSLPKNNEPLRHWQAVVVGGGIINGLSLQGGWPRERIAEIIGNDKELKSRWTRTLELAPAMADDLKVSNGTRYDALRILGVDTWEKRGAHLMKYLPAGVNDELQQGAISGLSDVKSPKVAGALLKEFSHFSPKNKNFALDALLRDESRIAPLLDAVAAGQIDAKLFDGKRQEKLKTVSNKRLRARIDAMFFAKKPAKKSEYFVGIASIDITPDYPIRLHGYLARTNESQGVSQHLFAKALAIGTDSEGPAILISVDNCMVPESIRNELLKRLASKGISSEKFAICSSHTHAAPKLAGVADNIFGMDIPAEEQAHIDRYTAEFTDKLEQVALAALKDRQPSELSWGKTQAGFAANRRTKGGPVDHELPVLKITSKDGKTRGIVANYACHCTTLGAYPNEISADWAGYAQEYMQRDFPGSIAMTVMGCGADSNPSPRPGVENAKQHGESIASAVKNLLAAPQISLSAPLECRTKRITLDFDTLPTRAEFEERAKKNDPTGYHARKNLARLDRGEKLQTELPYLVQTWNFGDELALVFLPGEVVVDYSLRLKNEFDAKRLWVNAYANDVPCYIPSKRVWNEGGYEGGGAMIYYDRPTRLAENTEQKIISAVHDIMPETFLSESFKAAQPKPTAPKDVFRTFKTKRGFIVDLVACEPEVLDPVAIDFRTDGKIWVLEMRDYPAGMDGNYKAGGCVRLIEDTDGDGLYEKSTLFLSDLPFPTGIMQWRNGVLICAAPDILYAEDTNGDGKADVVKKLFTGFATHNYQARVNSLRWGLDNWVYGAAGLFGGKIKSEITGKEVECSGRDIRFNPDTGEIEPVSGLSQQGRVRDDWGNWFGCDNSTWLWNFPMPDYYVRRNPNVVMPEPRIYGAKGSDPNKLFPASKTLERFNNPNSANRTTSAAGVEIYRDNLLGDEFYGNAFTGETVHNLVHRLVLKSDGVTLTGQRAADEQSSEFLASTDNWYRPVEIRTGPDGALWVSDMYRYVIEHPRWIPAERLAQLDVRAGDDKGRIYRVFPAGKTLRKVRDLTRLDSAKLVDLLDTPNGTMRDLIHRELYQRQDRSVAKALRNLALHSDLPAVRVQALCVLQGLKSVAPEDVLKAFDDSNPQVRRNAIRISENFLSGGKGRDRYRLSDQWFSPAFPLFRDKLLAMTSDSDRGVRYQLALSLGEWSDFRAAAPLSELARQNLSDAWIRAAVLSSASQHSAEICQTILQSPPETDGRTEMLSQLIATAAGQENSKALETIIVAIAPQENETLAAWKLVLLADLQEALERKKLSLEHFLSVPNRDVRVAAERIQASIHEAAKLAGNESASLDEREAAIRFLSSATAEKEVQTLIDTAMGGANARLQKAALNALRRQKFPKLPEMLLAGWKNYLVTSRPTVIEILLSRTGGSEKLLDAVEEGKIVAPEIPPASRQKLLQHENPKLKKRAVALLPQNGNRQEILAKFLAEVPKLTGNPDRGALIFDATCATCHAFRGQGHAVGPDLMPLADKTIEDFLIAIIDPNAVIEPRFVQYTIETKDDRTLSGVIGSETATSLVLSQPGGIREKLLRSDVVSMRASSFSLMPEGLEQASKPQDFADLISYLKSRRPAFGSATAEAAAEARKRFSESATLGIAQFISSADKLDYGSWLGRLPMAYCRVTDGKSKVAWQGTPVSGAINKEQFYSFRFPIAMGLYSQPAGKFHLNVNGKNAVDFDVVLDDKLWQSKDGKVSMRYQVMENSTEDSNGVLTISVSGELLTEKKSPLFEVTTSAAKSQRWFGLYLLNEKTLSSTAP